MQIFLVNHKNHKDINAFSGAAYFLSRAIKEEFEEVIEYDLPETEDFVVGVHNGHFEEKLRPVGKTLSNFLQNNNVGADFILCLGGNTAVPFYEHNIPIVYWHDCTWHTLLGAYASPARFEEFKIGYKNFHLWDISALKKADIVIFSSAYIAEACIRDYKIASNKVKVIPFGANLYQPPAPDFLQKALEIRSKSKTLHLTFYGKEWKRKGLQNAYLLTLTLNNRGIHTILNIICGDPVINDLFQSPFVKNHGYINKSDKNHYDQLEGILQQTHFLVHPAIAEPFGIALCEANAYGIPVIGTEVGGLKTIVINGRNGYLFKPENFVKEASLLVKDIFDHFDTKYPPLFHSSLREFNQRLNWKSSVKELRRILSAH
jgi:glycosyltransferase involved in cell wall biosynthesis